MLGLITKEQLYDVFSIFMLEKMACASAIDSVEQWEIARLPFGILTKTKVHDCYNLRLKEQYAEMLNILQQGLAASSPISDKYNALGRKAFIETFTTAYDRRIYRKPVTQQRLNERATRKTKDLQRLVRVSKETQRLKELNYFDANQGFEFVSSWTDETRGHSSLGELGCKILLRIDAMNMGKRDAAYDLDMLNGAEVTEEFAKTWRELVLRGNIKLEEE